MERILQNLVDNAVKHGREDGHITVLAKADSDHVAITVTDDGPGIPAEDLPRIFERFYRAKKGRDKESSGLGLAIAKHLVESMGGSISADSEAGKGARFCVRLPRAKEL